MRELRDRVAVITGAASGIGHALARSFAAEGMRLVLADVEAPALGQAVDALATKGAVVRGIPTDVANAEQVDALARADFDAFGSVHVLSNNAGVWGGTHGSRLWEHTHADREWTLGVNLWGVVHGIRAFVPRMLAQGSEGHVVNTASLAGLMSGRDIYGASKHAVVSISESLHHDLAAIGSKLRVSVLCPGLVETRIFAAGRNRPESLRDATTASEPPSAPAAREREIAERLRALPGVRTPDEVAARVVEGVHEERFWILPHGDRFDDVLRRRFEGILARRNPEPQADVTAVLRAD
jgi:NAD(P)-dependent dehydrogenase (short-subunit alcohol dehydrogenase family)